MNIKFAYETLCKKPIFFILTLIQLIIGIFLIYSTFCIIDKTNNLLDISNKIYSDSTYLKISGEKLNSANMDLQKLTSIDTFLNNNKSLQFISLDKSSFLIDKNEILPDSILSYSNTSYNNKNYMLAKTYQVNYNFINNKSYKLLCGETKEFETYKYGDDIPVILGFNYDSKYYIGDKINALAFDENGKRKEYILKVVGILDKSQYTCEIGDSINITSLDNYIMIPFYYKDITIEVSNHISQRSKKIELYNYIFNGYIKLKENINIRNLEKDLSSYGYKITLQDVKTYTDRYKKANADETRPILTVAIIIIIFTSISLAVVMLESIIKDLKDYGINIIVGATLSDIKNRVLWEIVILYCLSFALSILIIMILLKNNVDLSFKLISWVKTLIIMSIIQIFISKVVILKLKKYSINDLVRRHD